MRDVTDDEFEQVVASGRVLVDFYSTWCQPCKPLAVLLERLEPQSPGTTFVKVNVNEHMLHASRLGVGALPTLILFEDGEPVKQQLGGLNASALKEWIGV